MDSKRLQTEGLHGPARIALVRDAAYDLFNLEADLGRAPAAHIHADIHVQPGKLLGVVDVTTSGSTVRRTPRRAAAAGADDLLVYLIRQGGSSFRNARGEEFTTRAGSIVLGSQAAPYLATAAAGRDWRFRTLRIASDRLPLSGDAIRNGGFQLLTHRQPLAGLTAEFLAAIGRRGPSFALGEQHTALQALDTLLATTLGNPAAAVKDGGNALHVARRHSADAFIARTLHDHRLGPRQVALHVGISLRQLHRMFGRDGISVAGEIRRLRVAQAQALLLRDPARSVTEVAMACGFESLPTFYRSFRSGTGMTAGDWRAQRDGPA